LIHLVHDRGGKLAQSRQAQSVRKLGLSSANNLSAAFLSVTSMTIPRYRRSPFPFDERLCEFFSASRLEKSQRRVLLFLDSFALYTYRHGQFGLAGFAEHIIAEDDS